MSYLAKVLLESWYGVYNISGNSLTDVPTSSTTIDLAVPSLFTAFRV